MAIAAKKPMVKSSALGNFKAFHSNWVVAWIAKPIPALWTLGEAAPQTATQNTGCSCSTTAPAAPHCPMVYLCFGPSLSQRGFERRGLVSFGLPFATNTVHKLCLVMNPPS